MFQTKPGVCEVLLLQLLVHFCLFKLTAGAGFVVWLEQNGTDDSIGRGNFSASIPVAAEVAVSETDGLSQPTALTVDKTTNTLYFTDNGPSVVGIQSVFAFARSPALIVPVVETLRKPEDLEYDDSLNEFFFISNGALNERGVYRWPLGGPDPVPSSQRIVTDSGNYRRIALKPTTQEFYISKGGADSLFHYNYSGFLLNTGGTGRNCFGIVYNPIADRVRQCSLTHTHRDCVCVCVCVCFRFVVY